MSGGGQTYLPLRVNMAGVIPVIFAASIMAFPPTVGQLINTPFFKSIATFFSPQHAPYIIGESVFIILFTYFYTAVTFNPVDQAENLKKYGGFIPGALYLAAVAAFPTILIAATGATQSFYFGGTSLLIVIGVALDTMKQLEAQLMMRNYEGFLK
jgi:preprotein translocase subunit SecY